AVSHDPVATPAKRVDAAESPASDVLRSNDNLLAHDDGQAHPPADTLTRPVARPAPPAVGEAMNVQPSLLVEAHDTEEATVAALHDAAAYVGVRKAPPMLLAPDDCPPALVGVWRPKLLLSGAVLASLSADGLRLVLLHELVHLRRRDVLANWVLAALAAVH